MFDRPSLYFRRRENGTVIFRITENQHSRLDLQQIGILKPNGEIKPHNKQELSEEEHQEVQAWHAARQDKQNALDMAKIDTLIGDLNKTAQWLQTKANKKQLREISEPMLMAIHDLRTSIVKSMGAK